MLGRRNCHYTEYFPSWACFFSSIFPCRNMHGIPRGSLFVPPVQKISDLTLRSPPLRECECAIPARAVPKRASIAQADWRAPTCPKPRKCTRFLGNASVNGHAALPVQKKRRSSAASAKEKLSFSAGRRWMTGDLSLMEKSRDILNHPQSCLTSTLQHGCSASVCRALGCIVRLITQQCKWPSYFVLAFENASLLGSAGGYRLQRWRTQTWPPPKLGTTPNILPECFE